MRLGGERKYLLFLVTLPADISAAHVRACHTHQTCKASIGLKLFFSKVGPMALTQSTRHDELRDRTVRALKSAGVPEALRLLTRSEVAGCLGISLKTLDGVVRRGEITPLRIGKKVLFPRSQVEEFLTGNRSK
jgi:excisionase family DNA binding protein